MSLKIITGNIFTSQCQVLVNTVNCVGVMGAGIALEYRLRYPKMYQRYVELCNKNQFDIGLLWIYKSPDRWILNFPTKTHWRYPSKEEYLHAGLKKFVNTYKEKGIKSIAFPLLGADKGGLGEKTSLSIIKHYLEPLDIDIEVYIYSQTANDDLYEKTKNWFFSQDVEHISKSIDITKSCVAKVLDAMHSPNVYQLNQLGSFNGIGTTALEKIFNFSQNCLKNDLINTNQKDLLQ